MERKRATQRRYVYSARRDPITRVDYGHDAGSWSEVFAVTGWRPMGVIRLPLSKTEREWLERFNGGKSC